VNGNQVSAGLEDHESLSLLSCQNFTNKGLSIEDVRSRGFVQCGQGEGVLRMRTSAFYGAKTLDFWNLWCVSTSADILRTRKG